MTRFLILATIILSIASYASAQYVDTLNTPLGPVTQGAKVSVSWTLLAGADATNAFGDLSATDSATKNVVPIDPKVPLAPKTYLWNVQVPPGTYTLGLNDGSGLKQSGEVVVKAPGGNAPAPAPGDGGKTPAPAPAPVGKAPVTTPSPVDGGKAAPPASSAPSTPSTPSTPEGGSASSPAPTAVSTGSASSIFSGYDVVLSLLSVAVAMLQF